MISLQITLPKPLSRIFDMEKKVSSQCQGLLGIVRNAYGAKKQFIVPCFVLLLLTSRLSKCIQSSLFMSIIITTFDMLYWCGHHKASCWAHFRENNWEWLGKVSTGIWVGLNGELITNIEITRHLCCDTQGFGRSCLQTWIFMATFDMLYWYSHWKT